MDTIITRNIYTGRQVERKVIKKNKNGIVLEAKEFCTGREIFYFRPSSGTFYSEHLGEWFRL